MRAKVVYERQDAFDLHHGPYGYERVGFCIGERVFWTGCCGTGLQASYQQYETDKALAEEIVRCWNDTKSAEEERP